MLKNRTRVTLALLATALALPLASPASAQPSPSLQDLQKLVDAVALFPDRFAGVSTDSLEQITIHAVGTSKVAAAPAITDAARSLRLVGARVDIVPAKYSMLQLKEVESRIRARGPFAGPLSGTSGGSSVLSSYAINPRTNRVEVGVTKLSPGLAAEVTREFGDYVQLRVRARPTSKSRLDDHPPLYGGDRITGGPLGISCTSGFAMKNASAIIYEITAGHCFSLGTMVSANTHLSRVAFHRYGNFEMDNALLENLGMPAVYTAGSGRIWTGGLNTTTSEPVRGSADSCENCRVFFGGSYTGSAAGTLLGPKGNVIIDDDGVDVEVANAQEVIGDFTLCQDGDSGGPVYAYKASGGVDAVGIITAGYDENPADCFYTSVPDILNYWRGTIIKG